MTRREAKGLLASVKDRINDVKKFGFHAAAFFTFNMAFFMLNVTQGPDGPLFLLPFLSWGSVLFVHWKRVFGRKGSVERKWEEAMLHEFMYGEELPEQLSEIEIAPVEKRKLINITSAKDEKIKKLQRRLENLEAIVTSQKWEELEEQDEPESMSALQIAKMSKQLR
ncbi:MAG: 2TM domain-containing protein [Bacteroidota bacterium]